MTEGIIVFLSPFDDNPSMRRMSANPSKVWRDLLFICDEYHAFATVGETDPTGDERAFALSRPARLSRPEADLSAVPGPID